MVLDGGSSRLELAQRFRQQVLQEHPRPGRPLEPAHLLIRCPRASSPPPRSRPWQIDSSTARLLLPSAFGSPPIPITPPVPPCSPASPWPVVASRSSQTHRLLPAPASTASSSATLCVSPSGGSPAAPALGLCPRSLPANGRVVGCRAGAANTAFRPRLWRTTLVAIRAQRSENSSCDRAARARWVCLRWGWLGFQDCFRSIRKKPGFLRMIRRIDAELVP